jgi:hypothetical protein
VSRSVAFSHPPYPALAPAAEGADLSQRGAELALELAGLGAGDLAGDAQSVGQQADGPGGAVEELADREEVHARGGRLGRVPPAAAEFAQAPRPAAISDAHGEPDQLGDDDRPRPRLLTITPRTMSRPPGLQALPGRSCGPRARGRR